MIREIDGLLHNVFFKQNPYLSGSFLSKDFYCTLGLNYFKHLTLVCQYEMTVSNPVIFYPFPFFISHDLMDTFILIFQAWW